MRPVFHWIGLSVLLWCLGCSETKTNVVPIGEALGVEGIAQLQGAPDDGHSGIRVEVVGTRYSTTTASSGAFFLEAEPGKQTLRFTCFSY